MSEYEIGPRNEAHTSFRDCLQLIGVAFSTRGEFWRLADILDLRIRQNDGNPFKALAEFYSEIPRHLNSVRVVLSPPDAHYDNLTNPDGRTTYQPEYCLEGHGDMFGILRFVTSSYGDMVVDVPRKVIDPDTGLPDFTKCQFGIIVNPDTRKKSGTVLMLLEEPTIRPRS